MRRDYRCPKLVLLVTNGVLGAITIDSKGSLREFLIKLVRFLFFGRVVHHDAPHAAQFADPSIYVASLEMRWLPIKAASQLKLPSYFKIDQCKTLTPISTTTSPSLFSHSIVDCRF
jgi:hypothetical protein